MPNPPTNEHYTDVINAVIGNRLVLFLGAGVNLCGRPKPMEWKPEQAAYLPNAYELASYLKDKHTLSHLARRRSDLERVAEYIVLTKGDGPLYDDLHSLFDRKYPPTEVHRLLASLPTFLRSKGYPHPHQLIVTTNYDDLVESAFIQAGEPFDLVSYVAHGEYRGRFLHWFPDGQVHAIEKPNEYLGLSLERRSIILKVHGAVDRISSDVDDKKQRESYVIAEDHYIDPLTTTDLGNLLPKTIMAKLKYSNFLFLGYSLRDWNLRVILRRMWGERPLEYNSWSIQLDPDPIDEMFWEKRGKGKVDILTVSLEEYAAAIKERLQALSKAGGAA